MSGDQMFLQQALVLATQGRGHCAPNPAVGAVVVKQGRVLGQGYHRGCGQVHAEVEALASLDEAATGATLYVTLEPCCHWGKTPPCVDVLAKAQLARVVYGLKDPNPAVAGQGVAQLQAKGIVCEQVELAEIKRFYQSYGYWWRSGKPWVTAKLAMSLDGKIAGHQGEPLGITGRDLQQLTHQRRGASDALLTTINTIINDDPAMNVRVGEKTTQKPLYVLDSQLRLPLTSQVVRSLQSLTVFHAEAADAQRLAQLKQQGVKCVMVEQADGALAWQAILAAIGADGVHDLWVEAGGKCFYSLYRSGFLNRALLYVAPKYLGDQATSAFAAALDLTTQALTWQQVGNDVVCELELNH